MTHPRGWFFRGLLLAALVLPAATGLSAPAATASARSATETEQATDRRDLETADRTAAPDAETLRGEDRGIPDVLVAMAASGGSDIAYAVIVEKSTQRLFLYAYDGAFKKVFETDCSTGKAEGPKREKGDSKTPEGIYFFNDEHDDKELSPIYGVKAFPTDYPNLLDRIAGFTGSAIWLHGTNKPLLPKDSNGCIVLGNQDILKVTPHISLHRTPIIVVDVLSYGDPELNRIAGKAAAGFLKDWETALETGSYHDYLAHYGSAYLPDIAWWNTWRRYREKGKAKGSYPDVEIRNVSIFRYKDIYAVLFDEFLETGDDDAKAWPTGTRKLFMAYEDDRFAIVGDTYQTLPASLAGQRKDPPLIAVLSRAESERAADAAVAAEAPRVIQMVDKWLQAWSDKDIKAYGSFYADDFRSDGRDKSAYLEYKDRLNRIYDYIRVERGDLSVEKGDNGRLIASFVQKYHSSAHRTVGAKRLVLKEEKGAWKILRETWHRK